MRFPGNRLRGIQDFVDVDKGVARVKFTYQGQEVEWKLRVDNDWLDENVLALYGRLLQGGG